jgi:NAD(P)H-nitrite reductase large subunit
MRYVIVGNSAAAVGAIEALRQHDLENPITVVAAEAHHVYSRPLISYLLGGLVDESQMSYRPPDFYDRYQVDTMLGTEVVCVTPQAQTISLAGGDTLSYDRLLIAAGGVPFVPPVPGADLEGVFTFTRWDDARQIARCIEEQRVKSALVVGGGLIGLKTTEALMAHSIRVTVVELADRILSVSLDHTASRLVESLLRRANVEIRTGTTVKEIIGRNKRVDHAILRDEERVDCDLVVFAIGVRPNTAMIPQEAGIGVDRGVLVDDHMRTSAPHVYAAGDCIETHDVLLQQSHPIAIWPNAYHQGYVAGCSMAGEDKAYRGGFAMNSIEVCGVPTTSVGLTAVPENDNADRYDIMVKHERETTVYRKLVLRDNQLVGAICIGNIDRAGIYTGLIRDQVDVGPFKDHLLSGSFGLISLPRAYRKHMVVGEGIEV